VGPKTVLMRVPTVTGVFYWGIHSSRFMQVSRNFVYCRNSFFLHLTLNLQPVQEIL
jgi:hypothetical protein